MNILEMNLTQLREALDKKELTSVELTQFYLDRIEKYDSDVQAYITVNEKAIEQAKAADEIIAKGGDYGFLTGIPVALKDLIVTGDMLTTCGSKILTGFMSPYDGTAYELLKEAGAVFLGKLSMDEFAMGSSNETSYFKKTKNPWDLEKVPGGSSGGSAAAIAAGLAPVTLGSDTGGSIRQPASLCGVVGLKPTYGRVSRYGLVAFGSSLDQIGPMSKYVEDSAQLLSVIGKHDPKDSTSAPVEQKDYAAALTGDIKGMKVGIPKEYFAEGLDGDTKEKVNAAIEKLKELGAEPVEISLPHTDYAIATYYIIATAEASSNLSRFDGVKYGYRADEVESLDDMYLKTRSEGFGDEVKRRIMLGTYVLSAGYYDAYYLKAQKVRTLIKQDFTNAFKEVDAIVCPVAPNTAFKAGEKSADPVEMYLSDIYTISLNLFGGCGISVPCGLDSSNMPIGLQILGNYFEEDKILNIAYAYQQASGLREIAPEKYKN